MQVILNRCANPAYPEHDLRRGLPEREDWRNRCQFSFACDNIIDRIRSREHWAMAREVALAVTAGKIWLKEVGSSTHYHAVYVLTELGPHHEEGGAHRLHVFYRTYGGGGWS